MSTKDLFLVSAEAELIPSGVSAHFLAKHLRGNWEVVTQNSLESLVYSSKDEQSSKFVYEPGSGRGG